MLLNLPLNHYLLFEGVITADLRVKRQCEVSEAFFFFFFFAQQILTTFFVSRYLRTCP